MISVETIMMIHQSISTYGVVWIKCLIRQLANKKCNEKYYTKWLIMNANGSVAVPASDALALMHDAFDFQV